MAGAALTGCVGGNRYPSGINRSPKAFQKSRPKREDQQDAVSWLSAGLQKPGNRTRPPVEMPEADLRANRDIVFKEAVDDVIRIRRCSLLQEIFQVGAVPYLHDITPVNRQ